MIEHTKTTYNTQHTCIQTHVIMQCNFAALCPIYKLTDDKLYVYQRADGVVCQVWIRLTEYLVELRTQSSTMFSNTNIININILFSVLIFYVRF